MTVKTVKKHPVYDIYKTSFFEVWRSATKTQFKKGCRSEANLRTHRFKSVRIKSDVDCVGSDKAQINLLKHLRFLKVYAVGFVATAEKPCECMSEANAEKKQRSVPTPQCAKGLGKLWRPRAMVRP